MKLPDLKKSWLHKNRSSTEVVARALFSACSILETLENDEGHQVGSRYEAMPQGFYVCDNSGM
jgi:hypothetical protein